MACEKCGRWIDGIDCPSTLNPACKCSASCSNDFLCCPRYTDERVVVWPDGDWCWESDLPGMGHKSDDYQLMPAQYFFVDNEI